MSDQLVSTDMSYCAIKTSVGNIQSDQSIITQVKRPQQYGDHRVLHGEQRRRGKGGGGMMKTDRVLVSFLFIELNEV